VKGEEELREFLFLGLQALDDRLDEGSNIFSHLDHENEERASHLPGRGGFFSKNSLVRGGEREVEDAGTSPGRNY